MSAHAAIALAAFLLEHDHFRTALLIGDDDGDGGFTGVAADESFFSTDEQNFGQLQFAAQIRIQFFDAQNVARFHCVLLPTGFDNGVHVPCSYRYSKLNDELSEVPRGASECQEFPLSSRELAPLFVGPWKSE